MLQYYGVSVRLWALTDLQCSVLRCYSATGLHCYSVTVLQFTNSTNPPHRPTPHNQFTHHHPTLTPHIHTTAHKLWPVQFLSSLHCSSHVKPKHFWTPRFHLAAPVSAQYTDITLFAFKLCLITCSCYRDWAIKWHCMDNWSRITVCGQPQLYGSSLFASDTWYAISSDQTKLGPTKSAALSHCHDKWHLLIWYCGTAEGNTGDCGQKGSRSVYSYSRLWAER